MARDDLTECFQKILDFGNLSKEIEVAKPKGDLDMVFKKYCNQTPGVQKCIDNYLTVLEQCLDDGEKTSKANTLNVTNSLMNFICHKGGDRIALFIAEGGPECITDHANAISECVNKTLTDGKYDRNVSALVFDKGQCTDVSELQACVVRHLEACKEPTPANVMDSLFKFVIKSTPCREHLTRSGASKSYFHTSPFLVVSWLFLIIYRF